MVWVWTVSLPVTLLNSPNITQFRQPSFNKATDIAGIILWVIGFLCETISDSQKFRFRTQHGSDGAVMDKGLFSWSRHPNYFGEIALHFGMKKGASI